MSESAEGRPTVYVVEQQPFDYTSAEAYGQLKFLEAKKLAPDAPSAGNVYNSGVVHQIRRELGAYVAGYDYVIPTGSPSRMLVVGMVLAEKGKRHQLLGWDGRTSRYMEYTVVL